MKTFTSVLEMVTWLITHEGKVLKDGYGRQWMYRNYSFFFKDIHEDVFYPEIKCLHLFGTVTNPDQP